MLPPYFRGAPTITMTPPDIGGCLQKDTRISLIQGDLRLLKPFLTINSIDTSLREFKIEVQ